MYFKRISDLHPLDATTLIAGTTGAKSKYYDLDTLWIETAQTFITADEGWTPVSSSPSYSSNLMVDENGNKLSATNHETLISVDAYLSRKCSLAEVFRNVGDINTTYITAKYADLSYITSYYLEGKHDANNYLYFNIKGTGANPDISSTAQLSATQLTHTHGSALTGTHPSATYENTIANAAGAAVTMSNTGLTAKQVHSQFQFSVDYRGATGGDIGTGVSANCTGITANNIVIPGEATLTAAAAYWADLAELYSADAAYTPGTLVKFGGEAEVTIADIEANAVVTEKPAYLMNTALRETSEYPTGLVLTGRSRVRVIGAVNKFDRLGLSIVPGVAKRVEKTSTNCIGIALETNLIADEKLVEATLKLTF